MESATVLSYGGGRQTVAMCVLVVRGILPKPDRIVMADTSRENPMTWEYLNTHIQPLLANVGMRVEIAPHSLATVDVYAKNGDVLIPVFTESGKLSAYCSGEWKRDVCDRYLRQQGIDRGTKWIGFARDEMGRASTLKRGKWELAFPLIDLMLTSSDCERLVAKHGLPVPHRSSCWMCPHKSNSEWRVIREQYPDKWEEACRIDEQVREEDIARGNSGMFLHKSRVPLREADLSETETKEAMRQCGLGTCFV